MFEDDDFEIDDDFISCSFTTTQSKSSPVAPSKLVNCGTIIQVSENPANSFKKPQVSVPKTTCTLTKTKGIQQPQRPTNNSVNKPVNASVFGLKCGERSEECKDISENTDRLDKVAKRKFPGPAGLLPDDKSSIINEEVLKVKKSKAKLQDNGHEIQLKETSMFKDGPWLEMVQDFRSLHPANVFLPDKYNIRWIKINANLNKLIDKKVPFLAAVVQNIQANSTLTSVNLTLKDTTGEIHAAIHHTLFTEYSEDLTIGSVIVLRQFGVFTIGVKTHITIAPNNLITIYSKKTGKKSPHNKNRKENFSTASCTNDDIKKTLVQEITSEELIKQVRQEVSVPMRELVDLHSTHFANMEPDQPSQSIKRNILSLKKTTGTTSMPLQNETRSGLVLNGLQGQALQNNNPLNAEKMKNHLLQGECQVQKENHESDNCYIQTSKANLNINLTDSFGQELPTSNITHTTFKSKKAQNIFDVIDDDLNLTLSEEFGSDMNFETEVLPKGDHLDKENNKFNGSNISRTEQNMKKSYINYSTDERVPPKMCAAVDKDETEPANVKIKAALQKFKFKPRKSDEKVDKQQKTNTEVVSKERLNKDQAKQRAMNNVNGQDLNIPNSQLSLKTTNVEHNKIWKNLFDDIDTDSLFDDF